MPELKSAQHRCSASQPTQSPAAASEGVPIALHCTEPVYVKQTLPTAVRNLFAGTPFAKEGNEANLAAKSCYSDLELKGHFRFLRTSSTS